MRTTLRLAAALAAACAADCAAFTLVEGGRPVAEVEIAASGEKTAKGAADDVALFNRYLKEVTGAELPVAKSGLRNAIRIEVQPVRDVGRRFEWRIDFPAAGRMVVTATEKSLFVALRSLLEDGCDARFLGSEKCMFQFEPRRDVSVADEPRKSAARSFSLHRGVCHLLGREREMGLDNDHHFEFSHGIPVYAFPHGKYAKEGWPAAAMPVHGGKRIKGPNPKFYFGLWQPCYSSLDAAQIAVSNILDFLRANPGRTALTLAVNDCGGYCECEECRAMDANAERSLFSNDPENRSSSYYTFANRVIGEVEKEFPGIRYGALAYTGTVMPPPFPVNRKIVPMITLDTVLAAMDPETTARQNDIIRRWGEKVDEIGIWEYNWGRPFCVPRVNFAASAARLKFLYANGGRAYFSENNGDMLDGPKTYLVSRLVEDIDRDPAAVLDEWYARFAGAAAAPELKALYSACEAYWTSDAMKRSPCYALRRCILLNKSPAQFFALEPGFTAGLLARARKVLSLASTPGQRRRAEVLLRHFEKLDAQASFLGYAYTQPENGEFASAADAAAALNALADKADELMDEWDRSTAYFRDADFDDSDAYVRRGSLLVPFDPVPLLAEQFGRTAVFASDPAVAAALRRVASVSSLPARARGIAMKIASDGGASEFSNPGFGKPLSAMRLNTTLPSEITDEVSWNGEKTVKVFPGRPDGDPNPWDLMLRHVPTFAFSEDHEPGFWKVAVRIFTRADGKQADLAVWRRCDGRVRAWSNVAYVPLRKGEWTTLVQTIDLTDASDGFSVNIRFSENFGPDDAVYLGGVEIVKVGPPGESERIGQAKGDRISKRGKGKKAEVLGERAVATAAPGPFCHFYIPVPLIAPGEEVVVKVRAALPEGAKSGAVDVRVNCTPDYKQVAEPVLGRRLLPGSWNDVEFAVPQGVLNFRSGKMCVIVSMQGGDGAAVSSATWFVRPSLRDLAKSAAGISFPEESLVATKEGQETVLPGGDRMMRVTFSCRDGHSFDAAVYTVGKELAECPSVMLGGSREDAAWIAAEYRLYGDGGYGLVIPEFDVRDGVGRRASDALICADYAFRKFGRKPLLLLKGGDCIAGAHAFGARPQSFYGRRSFLRDAPPSWRDMERQEGGIPHGLAVEGAKGRYDWGDLLGSYVPAPRLAKSFCRRSVSPVGVRRNVAGNVLVDFGAETFGWLEFLPPPASSGAYEVVLGELVDKNGSVWKPERSSVRADRLRGKVCGGQREFRVSIPPGKDGCGLSLPIDVGTIMPFRYAEIVAAPFEVSAANVRQVAVEYAYDMGESSFSCSDERLVKVWDFCKRTVPATSAFGLFVDGDRERLPYEGDASVAQLGSYAAFADPEPTTATLEYFMEHPAWPNEGRITTAIMAWEDWMRRGKTDFLERHYETLRNDRLMARYARESDGLLLTGGEYLKDSVVPGGGDVIDWPPAERDGFRVRPVNGVVNAYYHKALLCMADIARALGRTADADEFAARASRVFASYQRAFLDPRTGLYVDGEGADHSSLHVNAIALAFGLVPQERRARIADYCVSRGMACSVYFARYLFEALAENGREDAMIGYMLADNDRSWLGMLAQGATSTMESWNPGVKPNLDFNHVWGITPLYAISRFVLGVKPLEPGWKKVSVTPRLGPLKWAEGIVPTVHGGIRVRAERAGDGSVRLVCEPPPGVVVVSADA